jgi:hypothetical protein
VRIKIKKKKYKKGGTKELAKNETDNAFPFDRSAQKGINGCFFLLLKRI